MSVEELREGGVATVGVAFLADMRRCQGTWFVARVRCHNSVNVFTLRNVNKVQAFTSATPCQKELFSRFFVYIKLYDVCLKYIGIGSMW